ncbi:MAG: S-layer homology domain-containing protein, partial [Lachnospiraceae bacterium]|nr:S-layer homology domain-containing protein [Lachnospiraceae bacterium]
MKRLSRRVVAFLLSVVLVFSEFGTLTVQAEESTSQEGQENEGQEQILAEIPLGKESSETEISEEPAMDGEVTRLDMWQMLITAFNYTCPEDEYPDNYFNDIAPDDANIDLIMTATAMGLTDVKAGEDLKPEEDATREFAALLMCRITGCIKTSENYTFTEVKEDDTDYNDAIQAAIDAGWFTLSDGKFQPEEPVTAAELELMRTAAESAYADRQFDTSLETGFTLKAGIKNLGEAKYIYDQENDRLTIVGDTATGLVAGDKFVVLTDGVPDAYKADSVKTEDGNTIISVSYPEYDDVYDTLTVYHKEEFDLKDAELTNEESGATLTYIVGGTEEEGFEDGEFCDSPDEVGVREVSALEVVQKIDDIKFSKNYDEAFVRMVIHDIYAERQHNVNEDKLVIYGKMDLSIGLEFDLSDGVLKDIEKNMTITLQYGVFTFSVGPKLSLTGSISVT